MIAGLHHLAYYTPVATPPDRRPRSCAKETLLLFSAAFAEPRCLLLLSLLHFHASRPAFSYLHASPAHAFFTPQSRDKSNPAAYQRHAIRNLARPRRRRLTRSCLSNILNPAKRCSVRQRYSNRLATTARLLLCPYKPKLHCDSPAVTAPLTHSFTPPGTTPAAGGAFWKPWKLLRPTRIKRARQGTTACVPAVTLDGAS
jgi:hypothetical protein